MSRQNPLHNSQPRSPYDPDANNPFDEVEVLPGLGIAVLWVVVSYVFVHLLMLPAHVV